MSRSGLAEEFGMDDVQAHALLDIQVAAVSSLPDAPSRDGRYEYPDEPVAVDGGG